MADFDSEMRKVQKSMLRYAEELATNKGIVLDYTDKSIKHLDVLLEGVADEFKQAGVSGVEQFVSDDAAQGISESVGSYIVECFERNHERGVWVRDGKDGDQSQAIGYKTPKGYVVFPFDWVMKKIMHPKKHAILAAYKEWML
jgi:hypothetical protein